MSPREELLEALEVERLDQTWWRAPPPPEPDDSEITTARRVRVLLGDTKTNKEEVA